MANIPGISGYVQPNTFSRVRTLRRAVSIPGGLRIMALVGLGERQETVVLSALGNGADGLNEDFSGSSNPDGRHFTLSKTSLIPNRTTLLLDGIPLNGTEETITLAAFDSRFDYRLEPDTGRIELQRASLVDQGGTFALPGSSNVGDGTLTVELIDANAPTETWTIRATSVIRDAYGDPISGNATFTAVGSVSGQPLDAYGAPIVFIGDGETRDNGILRLTISEGATPFERSDRFTVKVASRQLRAGQTLEARYIAESDLYDPEFFVDPNSLFIKHGSPSETNTLALGASLAFENGAFGVIAVQAKPSLPRRTSDVLLEANDPLSADTEGYPPVSVVPISSDVDAFRFAIHNGGVPDSDSQVNIFVIDADTGDETQIFPTKVNFYDAGITSDAFNNFIDSPSYTFSYTVILDSQVEDSGDDGEVTIGTSTFTADSATFSAFNLDTAEEDTVKQIRILNRDKFGNDTSDVAGVYDILSVGGGSNNAHIVTLTNPSAGGSLPFGATFSDLVWELLDPADQSARLLFTTDLQTSGTIGRGDGLRITYIDQDDASFFDSNWALAYDTLEAVDAQMIVPLPDQTISAIQQAGLTHVELMSNTANQKERMLLTGAMRGITAAALIGTERVAVENIGVLEGVQGDDAEEVLAGNIEDLANYSIADAFGTSFRVVYFFPDQIVRVINGTSTAIHGFYMAAAAGGLLASQPNFAMPLTRKNLVGFSISRDRTYKQVTLNALGNAGVTVVVPVVGGGQVLHGKTTSQSGAPEEEEISVVFIRDRVAQVMRDVLRGFIGQPEDPTLTAAITSVATKTLQALVGQGLLSDFRNLTVNRDEVDPRQWNVGFDVQPVYPVNWIFIDVNIGVL